MSDSIQQNVSLPKHFEPAKVEKKWYNFWIEKEFFAPSESEKNFSIVIPPPNVTGSLHMGHALNVTLQDILIRWKRMKGFSALWVPGTDHAGIATQNVVERHLQNEGLDRHRLGRAAFIEQVWKWKEQYGNTIINQLKRMGASCDWTRQRFTLDRGLSDAVREVFVQLFEEGLIYRDNRLINWCPRCHTALSDLEVEHEMIEGNLTYIKYPLEKSNRFLTVATTRPETMLGDMAVAVNPTDERFKNVIGKYVELPLTKRKIPVVADEAVDPEFGTGAVKVTPAHDFNDEAIAKRQSPPLQFLKVIDEIGNMTVEAGEKYAGLDRYDARKSVVDDLRAQGLIEKIEKHQHSIGHCYRCKTVIEPLSTIQWYVDVQDMARDAIDVVRRDKVKIAPSGWKNSYFAWMENINDWCISRQIWWGHQIPVWYCPYCRTEEGIFQGEHIYHIFFEPVMKDGEQITGGTYAELKLRGLSHDDIIFNSKVIKVDVVVKPICSRTDLDQCPECGNRDLIRDPDVLDTWFSSALWPFSTLGWPEKTKDLDRFYPTDVLVTGFDILFFWVARMIMMGLKFKKEIPFRDVYIHALVRDSEGKKMSKSKGNVIDPVIMVDKYGTDAFRFTLAAFAAQGRDIKFSEDRVEGYRHFVNKLWNASRYIMMNLEGEELPGNVSIKPLELTEKWIMSRLAVTAEEVEKALGEFRFNDAANAIYQFIWHELCDWYIEISKPILLGERSERRKSAVNCLHFILEKSLRLLHPFMPFVTEELWQGLTGKKGESIMIQEYPSKLEHDEDAERRMGYVMEAVTSIRSIRGELNVAPSTELAAHIRVKNEEIKNILNENDFIISKLSRLKEFVIGAGVKRPHGASASITSNMEIYVPIKGILDVDAELKRLKKDLDKVSETISFLDRKLLNEDFLSSAPKHIVEKEKLRYNEAIEKREKVTEQIERMKSLE